MENSEKPYIGYPNVKRQGDKGRKRFKDRDVNTLPDPKIYAFVSGLMGTAPDQQGFSVLHPDASGIRSAGNVGFGIGTALGMAPVAGAVAASKTGKEMARKGIEGYMGATGMRQDMLPPTRFVGRHLDGMPRTVDVGGRMEPFSTDQRLVDIAQEYMASRGLPYRQQAAYAEVDPARARRLADAFQEMPHAPRNPAVRDSYEALAAETEAQYEALLKKGYKFDFIRGNDPYGNPRNAINDLVLNKRMSVFPTLDGFGGASAAAVDVSGNPLLAKSSLLIGNDKNTTYNDLFRAVHDAFGHAKHGVGFRARGEENAFQSHAKMYSKKALPAATSETRGQNSWVNFGPFAKKNRVASPVDTEYAAQKTGLLPQWAWEDGLLR